MPTPLAVPGDAAVAPPVALAAPVPLALPVAIWAATPAPLAAPVAPAEPGERAVARPTPLAAPVALALAGLDAVLAPVAVAVPVPDAAPTEGVLSALNVTFSVIWKKLSPVPASAVSYTRLQVDEPPIVPMLVM